MAGRKAAIQAPSVPRSMRSIPPHFCRRYRRPLCLARKTIPCAAYYVALMVLIPIRIIGAVAKRDTVLLEKPFLDADENPQIEDRRIGRNPNSIVH
jgi:hypothetical protein